MNVEIGAEAAQFPEKEYINGIAIAVLPLTLSLHHLSDGTPPSVLPGLSLILYASFLNRCTMGPIMSISQDLSSSVCQKGGGVIMLQYIHFRNKDRTCEKNIFIL
jgi:hypothetical protein